MKTLNRQQTITVTSYICEVCGEESWDKEETEICEKSHKYIYAVCRNQGGAHKSMDVMSVWTTEEKAESVVNRLNTCIDQGYKSEVKKWTLDIEGDTINW